MGKIKKLIESELIGGKDNSEIYPVTSTKAVFNSNNKDLDTILKETEEETYQKFSTLDNKVTKSIIKIAPTEKIIVGDDSGYKDYSLELIKDIAYTIKFTNYSNTIDVSLKFNSELVISKRLNPEEEWEYTPTKDINIIRFPGVGTEFIITSKADISEIVPVVNNNTINISSLKDTVGVIGKSYTIEKSAIYYKGVNTGDTVTEYSSPGFWGIEISVLAGQSFKVGAIGSLNCRAWILADENKKVLSNAEQGASTIEEPITLTVEQNGFLYVNSTSEENKNKTIIELIGNGVLDDIIKQVSINTENIKSNTEAITELQESIGTSEKYYKFDLTGNYYRGLNIGDTVITNPYPNENYVGAKIQVKSGEVYNIGTIGQGNCRAWIIANNNNIITRVAEQNTNNLSNPVEITIEEDGYLYANCYIANIKDTYNEDCTIKRLGTQKNDSNLIPIECIGSAIFGGTTPYENTYKYYIKGSEKVLSKTMKPLLIVCGQSNTDGRAPEDTMPSGILDDAKKLVGYNMWNWQSNRFGTYQLGILTGSNDIKGLANDRYCFSYDVFFAKKWLEANPDKELYCLKVSKGATGIQNGEWSPEGECGTLINALFERVYRLQQWAIDNNVQFYPICMLYHQGEWDADTGASSQYKDNLSKLFTLIRGVFGASKLPIINGEVSETGKYTSLYAPINESFAELNAVDSMFKTIDMSEHQTFISSEIDGLGDLHYDASALQYMGESMYNEYIALVE